MSNTIEPPAGFPRPTDVPHDPFALGHPSGPLPIPPAAPAPAPSAWRQHLGALIVAAAILVVGTAGVVTWAATSHHDPAPTVTSPSTSSSTSSGYSSDGTEGRTYMDTRYLATLRQQGVPFTTEYGMIAGGHSVCNAISQGGMPGPLAVQLANRSQAPVWTPEQGGAVVGASIGAYCPQYKPLIGLN